MIKSERAQNLNPREITPIENGTILKEVTLRLAYIEGISKEIQMLVRKIHNPISTAGIQEDEQLKGVDWLSDINVVMTEIEEHLKDSRRILMDLI